MAEHRRRSTGSWHFQSDIAGGGWSSPGEDCPSCFALSPNRISNYLPHQHSINHLKALCRPQSIIIYRLPSMSQTASAELLGALFDPKTEHSNLKKDAISHLEHTFQFIDQNNFGDYIQYLIEWTLFEVNSSCLETFISKIRDLQMFLENKHPVLQQKMIMILFYLLQQEDPHVRRCAVDAAIQIFRSQYGITYLKKSVTQLLKSENNCSGFDSALVLFRYFRYHFIQDNEFVEILGHSCFFTAFKTKKIFLLRMLEMCQQELEAPLVQHLLAVVPLYIKQHDQMIHCLAIKLRIILLAQGIKHQMTNCNSCLEELTGYYAETLMRTKFVLIQVTEYIVRVLPPHLIRKHFEYLKANINPEESQITELAIEKLRIMFEFVSKDERKALMMALIKLDKQDHHIGDAIARNITELLLEQQNQSMLIDNLKEFIHQQKDTVKLSLLKSFFKYKKSNHWYNFLLENLKELMENKVWRVRLESLQILRRVMENFPVQNWMFPTLKALMFDKVSRIRLETIKLVSICVEQQSACKELVPLVLQQSRSGNYLYRETVLFFIRETYLVVSKPTKLLYKECLLLLKEDPVDNVKEIVREISSSYL